MKNYGHEQALIGIMQVMSKDEIIKRVIALEEIKEDLEAEVPRS